jgi:uncharacterized protein
MCLRGLVAGVLLLFLLGSCLAEAQPRFPELSGRVIDEAGLLSTEDRRALGEELKALEEKSSDQVVVFTTRSLQGYPIEDFGYQLGRKWGIGQSGKNNGIVVIVAPNDRKVRIEVGRGLEPEMTDLMAKLIIENAMLPAFRRGDFAGGIKAGVRDIRDVLLGDPEAVKERAKSVQKRTSGDELLAPFALALIIAMMIFIFLLHRRQAHQTVRNSRRRRYGDDNVIIVPGGWGGAGNWGGTSSSGSDGGFSGGGGDFGGGGASGGW